MNKKEKLQRIAKSIMAIDHSELQRDNIYACENAYLTVLELDKLDKHEAVRLLMHVIHVQQLQLEGAKIEHDPNNPFKDMVDFEFVDEYVKHYSPNGSCFDM